MNATHIVDNQRRLRKLRTRSRLHAKADRPRLVIRRSNQAIYAQVVGSDGRVLAAASSIKSQIKGPTAQAAAVGEAVAKAAQAAGINRVVFDRGAYLYHGRVKALAEAAREQGLKF